MSGGNPMSCNTVGPGCAVEDSIYGYYPSLGWNAFGVAFFAAGLVINIVLGIRYRTWTYMIAMGLGTFTSTVGYVGRVMMSPNPYNIIGFQIQICCLTLAPAFNSAAIYLTLKHVANCFGAQASRIRPKWYTWIFILCDLLALVFQGAGGGISATADNDMDMLHVGEGLMMAGVALQTATLFVFGLLMTDYILNRRRDTTPYTSEALGQLNSGKFKLFVGALSLAYLTVLIRCVYRLVEMSGGWGNPIMQDEALFIGLDEVMIIIAVFCQTAFHPGLFFPRLSSNFKKSNEIAIHETEKSTLSFSDAETRA